LTAGDNRSATNRSVRLIVDVEIRLAVGRDLAALGTWSGQVESTFRPAVEGDDRLLLIALANGGFPIGHALVDLKGLVSNVLVLRGFRDQGLGKALMESAEKLLRDRGVADVSLAVEKVNDDAIKLYRRLGYDIVGESVETWPEPEPDGSMLPVDHPAWLMRKEL